MEQTTEQLKEIFFDDVTAHADVFDKRYGQVAHMKDDDIPYAMAILYKSTAHLRNWGVEMSASGPVEVEDSIFRIKGIATFFNDGTGLLYTSNDKGYTAEVNLKPRFLDMIVIRYGSELDKNELSIHFITQVGPLGYARE